MMETSHRHMRSVNLLQSRVGDYGESASHLAVLAFEIALKTVYLSATGRRALGHDYWSIWNRLPEDDKEQIVASAVKRNAGHCDLTNLKTVFCGLESVFSQGRYSYEFNQGLTPNEISEKGRRWIESGARDEDAEIRYFPMERDGLTFGLFEWIGNNHDLHFNFEE